MDDYNTSIVTNEVMPSPSSVLTFGILSLVFCESIILGLIFGFMARSKAKKYINAGLPLPGQVKTGRILGLVGIICSFVMIAVWIIYIAVVVTAISQGFVS